MWDVSVLVSSVGDFRGQASHWCQPQLQGAAGSGEGEQGGPPDGGYSWVCQAASPLWRGT